MIDPLLGDHDHDDDMLFPSQSPAVTKEVVDLEFATRHFSIKLAVDPSPGCGGIAWPAGQVSTLHIISLLIRVRRCHLQRLCIGTGHLSRPSRSSVLEK